MGTSVPVLWGHSAVQITLIMLGQTEQYKRKKASVLFLGSDFFPPKGLKTRFSLPGWGLTYELPLNFTVLTPKILTPQLQGILCKVCSPFFHDEFKLAHGCVCITSNISTMNSFECVKKEND